MNDYFRARRGPENHYSCEARHGNVTRQRTQGLNVDYVTFKQVLEHYS